MQSSSPLFLYFSNSLSLSFSLSPSLHSSPLIFWLPVIILERSLLWGWAACSIPVRSIHACLPASLPEACLFAVGREESSYAALQCLLTACLAWLAVGPKGGLSKSCGGSVYSNSTRWCCMVVVVADALFWCSSKDRRIQMQAGQPWSMMM